MGPQVPLARQAGSVVRGTRSRPGAAQVSNPSPGPRPGAPPKTFARGGISFGSVVLHPASFSTRSQKPSASVSASDTPPMHIPLRQESSCVQVLSSSQTNPSRAAASKVQPPPEAQVSSVHGLPSSQVCGAGVPSQMPPVQVSPSVHESASSQDDPSVFAGCWHAPRPSHSSSVHGFESAVHAVPSGSRHESSASLHASAHSEPVAHGSPEWTLQPPASHVS